MAVIKVSQVLNNWPILSLRKGLKYQLSLRQFFWGLSGEQRPVVK